MAAGGSKDLADVTTMVSTSRPANNISRSYGWGVSENLFSSHEIGNRFRDHEERDTNPILNNGEKIARDFLSTLDWEM